MQEAFKRLQDLLTMFLVDGEAVARKTDVSADLRKTLFKEKLDVLKAELDAMYTSITNENGNN